MTTQPKTTLLAIRHGETEWNAAERYQGHEDSPLTDTGRNQAAALGRRLEDVAFDMLISSDLGRAKETASIIAGYTGHRLATDHRLRERNYGVLEGLTFPEIMTRHAAVLEQFNTDDPDYVIPGGESHRAHYLRNVSFLEELIARETGKTVAMVAHGGVLDSIFRYVSGLPLDHPRCFTVANTSLSRLSHGAFYGTTRWVIETWGDVGHLNGIGNYSGLG